MIIKENDVGIKDLGTHLIKVYADQKNYGKDCGLAFIEIKGKHPKVLNQKSDMLYYIIEGEGRFYIINEIYNVEKGDFLTVKKKTPYYMEGQFKVLNISIPCYDSKFDKVLE